ncbi:hypothetical protein M427DRAFT_292188 [Gonapodya prolifera JEL478]|uniref:Uncharacterized protein n=1 Tax=Gonapodya prolifera (strain JEL478) TaxID=1344416 RepID=A0A138ZX36_GONPJ|nr:hypothetical protein M427DRAFT_292188 [Gonapodya prolifera JEL478]|eukprot:KXS08835.1 hypothetical protein M427DRAFT_292188 [Gonapodya prolifera JEL478]
MLRAAAEESRGVCLATRPPRSKCRARGSSQSTYINLVRQVKLHRHARHPIGQPRLDHVGVHGRERGDTHQGAQCAHQQHDGGSCADHVGGRVDLGANGRWLGSGRQQ